MGLGTMMKTVTEAQTGARASLVEPGVALRAVADPVCMLSAAEVGWFVTMLDIFF